MSFWDHIKPAPKVARATGVGISKDGLTVALTWEEGGGSSASARTLRQQCPCAACVDEWTRKRTFDPAQVPEDMTIREVHPVGNYALSFVFGDGHQTGIFTWSLLREVTKPDAEVKPPPR